MRIVMNREFGIVCSYTLEASLSGYQGFHFSSKDLQTIGSDYCLALLRFYNVQYGAISKEISSPIKYSNQEEEAIESSDIIITVDEDSGGSDSNPSEDNLSESEALNLLSNSDIQKPNRKKKIKKRRKSKKKLKGMNSSDLRRLSAAKKCSNISLELNKRLSGRTRLDQENQDVTMPSNPSKSLTMLTFPLDEY